MYRGHYVEIFVWVDKPSMYAANDHNESIIHPGRKTTHDYLGQATAGINAVRYTGKMRRIAIPRKFGEIFFVTGNMSARVVAHEIQHIVNYWILNKCWDVRKMDERIATITGEMHRVFWREYFRRYE
jgi:hypothetical protein